MATVHIDAKSNSMIAETVLMPGDPLRAKYIADTYLSELIKQEICLDLLDTIKVKELQLWVQEWVCLLWVFILMNYLKCMMLKLL